MQVCEMGKCGGLMLPLTSLYVCAHCQRTSCFKCLKEHNLHLTMTLVNVPQALRSAQ
jgi:hypothetical protein